MINGWRRAFCTSIPKERSDDGVLVDDESPVNTQHKSISRFSFFSNPSTPRSNSGTYSLRCRTSTATAAIPPSPSPSLPSTPKLQCRTTAETTTPTRNTSFVSLLTTSSPKSPASFSLLKSKLRFNRSSNRCGICLQTAKTGQGTAIFTAECSHTFHFPCVTSRASDDRKLLDSCPICGASWRESSLDIQNYPKSDSQSELKIRESKNKSLLRVYNDDEPLISSPISPAGFHTILESDENDEELVNGEFRGFSVNTPLSLTAKRLTNSKNVDVKLSPEAAIVAVGKGYETYSVVVKVKSPPFPVKRGGIRRAPVDLVTVLDISGTESIETVKRAMNLVISSLRETDRLSIIAFSSTSKRLSPLRRMTVNGRRSARRIVEIITVAGSVSGGGNAGEGITVNDAVKKAVKVIEDRRQKNLFATVFVLTDRNNLQAHQAQSAHSKYVSSTRFSRAEVPVHTIWLGACKHALTEDIVNGCLSLTVQDLTIQLGLVSSDQGEIKSIYSISNKPVWLGTGLIRLGDMYSEEEKALLVEIKSPIGSHRMMTVRSRYVDPTTQEITNQDRTLQIPRPLTVRSSNPNISRLRNLHVSTRAVAESRRLIERNQYSAAQRLLTSARALLVQYDSNDACLRGIDVELMHLNRLRGRHVALSESLDSPRVNNKGEPLTPTSAWKTAEKLAKVAMMRKHMNRVSDLHGFENARF